MARLLIDKTVDTTKGCGPLLRGGVGSPKPLRQDIFEFVRSRGQAARADITQALDISAGSTTTLTAEMIASGHLREVEHIAREVGRGRPRVALEVVPDAAYVIGIKLNFSKHTAVLTDLAGNIVADQVFPSSLSRRTLPALVQEAHDIITAILTKAKLMARDIQAVGIGMPGIVDHHIGRIAWSPLLLDNNHDMSAACAQRLEIPVVIDNDANLLTLAELWFGEGRGMQDFAVMTIENGVGMGLVTGNELYRGANGMALELGHTKVQMDGAICQCGQRGCLEAYLADYVIIREARTLTDLAFEDGATTGEILDRLKKEADAGHQAAKTIFTRAANFLSLGLANVVQLFDPGLIILSGERMQNDYLFTDEVFTAMNSMTLNQGRPPCKVTVNAWDDLVWARGAAALALTQVTDVIIGDGPRTP